MQKYMPELEEFASNIKTFFQNNDSLEKPENEQVPDINLDSEEQIAPPILNEEDNQVVSAASNLGEDKVEEDPSSSSVLTNT